SGKNQLWVMSAVGGEARQLTHFKEGVGTAPVWSPDGTRIAFTASVGPDGPGSDQEKDAEGDLFAKYTKDVKRITRIHYKTDGEGFHQPDKREQLFVIAVAGEEPQAQQVTRGDWNHGAPAWSPNGKALAFVANRREDDDYYPFLEDLWVQELDQLAAGPRRITPGTFSLGTPAWSPDGTQIAFLGFEYDRFQGYSSNRLWVINQDGSGLRRVAANWDRTFGHQTSLDMPAPAAGSLTWTRDGHALIALGADRGRQQIYSVDASSGAVTALTSGDHVVLSCSLDARCGKLAVGLTRPDVPGDLYLVDGSALHRLTNSNESLLAELTLAPVEHFTFKTGGGSNAFVQQHGTEGLETETDGWVMKPADFSEHKRYPAVLEVHGGPMGQYGWAFMMEFQCLAAEGYAVVYTNPRGSQGYSEQFCACIKEDWGNLDYLDVMAGLDAAIARHPWIDPSRVGIAGGSYGGYMVNWALGQTERFKAAVTMRSCVNEASMVGTSDFGFVDLSTYPSRPWNDMAFYRRFSTITNVEKIVTPLLIEHQEEDYRCPMEQAEQLYTALKVLHRTVEFVRYPDSSHGMSRTGKPWLRVHRLRTICDWFDRFIEH
ncbi:MAG: acylaminoacyl-peptidase, partial [Firmicutes bacterium]|nr:acylaminoacyl-peptidase [Bacillota bacterium]